jgi:hypothetical protein
LQIPYSKVKKVSFIEGAFISKFIVSSEGGIFDDKEIFFIKDKGNFQLVKEIVSAFSNNQFTVVEKKSLLCRIIGSDSSIKKE